MGGWIGTALWSRRSALRIGLLAASVALLAAASWAVATRGSAAEPYRTALATVADVESTAVALGKIRPRDAVDVGAQVSGQLERVLVEVGDQVEKGQLLAEIDATVLQARVDAGRAQLAELEANRDQQRAEVKLARRQAERNQRLHAVDAVSEDEAQTSQAQLEVALARLAALEAQLERVRSTLEGDLANLSYTRIYAPISGTVVSQAALAGQTLNANQTTPTILRIADLTRMTVSADVSEADVTRLEPGMPVHFTTLGMPDRRWRSRLRQVLPEPEIVNDVVLYKALLDIANDDGALLPEMTAQVSFQLGLAREAVTIPLPALREGGRGERSGERHESGSAADSGWVMLLRDGEPERRRVEVGLRSRTTAQIVSGLAPGDRVVVGPLELDRAEPDRGGRGRGGFRGLRRML